MSEWRVETVRIGHIQKHPDADLLSITTVHDGYPCIVKTGDFQEGDLATYIPVDSVVPDAPMFAFLKNRRIKPLKLRGIFSMGLLVPHVEGTKEGDDVTQALGITRYEPAMKACLSGEAESAPNHFPFSRYTDIDSLRRFKRGLIEGEEVVLVEKIHGCFMSSAVITMFDGSKKPIKDVVVGDVVLGVDNLGNTVPSTVLNTWRNGKTNTWHEVKSTRRKVKPGNSFCRVVCTPNHEIAVKQKGCIVYKNACYVQPGDVTLIHRSDLSLPELQRQVLLGMILGDACISNQRDDCSWSVSWTHTSKDIEYVEWIERALGDVFSKGSRGTRISGFGSQMLTGRTIWSHSIRTAFEDFQRNGKKAVPSRVVQELTPLALAFWYMDDGSLGHGDGEKQDNTAGFATCSFDDEDHDVLLKTLARFGINAKVMQYDYRRIVLDNVNAEKLFLLIAPYIPPCMQRKLPIRYRGGPGWLPSAEAPQRYTQLIEQRVLSNEKIERSSERFDLTTETHNFFANETLVHNSNARYSHDGERLWLGSHGMVRKPNNTNVWGIIANQLNLEERLAKHPLRIFYGEIYGKGVQDLLYDAPQGLEFRVFDVFDIASGRHLDHDDMVKVVEELELKTPPILYRGPWNVSLIREHCEGRSTLNPQHVREGFVVRPVKERLNDRFERAVYKMVGEGYLMRKNSEDNR